MKRNILSAIALILAALLFLTACGVKEQTEPIETPDTAETADKTDETETESESETEPEPVQAEAPYKYVVVIGVDGAGTYFKDTNTYNIDHIFENGAVAWDCLVEDPSASAQGWASLLNGVHCDVHGLDNTIVCEEAYPEDSPYPTVFRTIRENMPDAKLASFVNWFPINTGIIEQNQDVILDWSGADYTVTDYAVQCVRDGVPTFMFIQYDEIDGSGHSYGWGSAKQLALLTKTDSYIKRLYMAYEDAGVLDETLFIVTADHGGIEDRHGGLTDEEKYVMFAAVGHNVVKGGTIEDMHLVDTQAVILYALGLSDKQAEGCVGRVPAGLFED